MLVQLKWKVCTHLTVVGLKEEVLAKLVEADEHTLERLQIQIGYAALDRV